MGKYTKEQILKIIEEKEIKFVRMQFTDIFGMQKNVSITTNQVRKALDNKCMFDGSSIEGFVRIEESDMYLYPDFDTFTIYPWHKKHGHVARLICDVYKPDGEPFEGDPRYILKKQIEEAKKMGFTFNVGPECEFFLFDNDQDGRPTTNTQDNSGYFDLGAVDQGEVVRRDICLNLEEMGFEIEASHHECAKAQHEIDFKYSDALSAADNLITFRTVVKSVSGSHGMYASFMPKPLYGMAGSGMHVNMSLFKDGKNAFYDETRENGLSDTALYFIGGILNHVKGCSALTNPTVNSYKRLVPGFEAPCYIAWTLMNRSALIRVPSARGTGTRIELRSPDPTGNPYLEFAVLLAAGMEGIKNKTLPKDAVSSNIYDLSENEREQMGIESLPTNLYEAVKEMKKDTLVKEVLGEHIFYKYIKAKSEEWGSFSTSVTQWEIDEYLAKF